MREDEEGIAHGEGDCRHREAPVMAEGVVYMVCGKFSSHLSFWSEPSTSSSRGREKESGKREGEIKKNNEYLQQGTSTTLLIIHT